MFLEKTDNHKHTWTRFNGVSEECRGVAKNVTHVPLVSFSHRLRDVLKVSYNPCHLLKILMLSLVTHAPYVAKWSTTTVEKKFVLCESHNFAQGIQFNQHTVN